jgi:predicted outer membrane repeat protein
VIEMADEAQRERPLLSTLRNDLDGPRRALRDRAWRWLGFALLAVAGAGSANVGDREEPRRVTFMVTTTADRGPGSLRQAILEARAVRGPRLIRFDSTQGPFATPQVIALRSPLPELQGELVIDGAIEDRLWRATGVTLSAAHRHRVLSIAPGSKVTLASFTIANGWARQGGGVLNRGDLVLNGLTFVGNRAERNGGAVLHLAGALTVVNSTFVDNQAGEAGGALADNGGTATVTHATFARNRSPRGGAIFSQGTLLLRNSILAYSGMGKDCVVTGTLVNGSRPNLIQSHDNCGVPVSAADPRLEALGLYNGPTPTMPPGGGSPAVNLGDNAAAVDEAGNALAWDQRGNGDPRVVAGFADLGAVEVQEFATLLVNTVEDSALRACTGVGLGDCPLRGAIELANAMGQAATIRFDPRVFSTPRAIRPTRPLPEVRVPLTLDARGTAGVTIEGESGALRAAAALTLREVRVRLAN